MPRLYTVKFTAVTVAAPQDLFEIKGSAGKVCRILRFSLADIDTTLPTAQMLELRGRYLPVTVTDGSGGSSPTPSPMDLGDSAASFSALANNTTKATTNSTAVVLYSGGCHIFSGIDYSFTRPPVIGNGEAFVFELLSTVSGTCTMSGQIDVEELGG